MKPSLLQRKIRPATTLKLAENIEFQIGFNMEALARIEDRTKLELVADIFELWRHLSSAKVLSATVWACICTHHREFADDRGYEVISSYIEGDNIPRVIDTLAEAYPKWLSQEQAEAFRAWRRRVEAILSGKDPESAADPSKPAEPGAPPAAGSDGTGQSSGPSPATISASA